MTCSTLPRPVITLADLNGAGALSTASIANWGGVDAAHSSSRLITQAALDAHDLVQMGDLVDLDELIDLGLVTFGELAEAGIVTVGSLVGNLGFVRDLNLLATNVADLGTDLTSHASVEDLVPLDDLLTSGVTTLEELFDEHLVDLGDINLNRWGSTA